VAQKMKFAIFDKKIKKFSSKIDKLNLDRVILCEKSISEIIFKLGPQKSEEKKSRHAQRLKYNFLLKRKLAIDVFIKVLGQILGFQMSGQQILNSIPTRSYEPNKKNDGFSNRGSVIRIVDYIKHVLKFVFVRI
jgi:hypothetical protein